MYNAKEDASSRRRKQVLVGICLVCVVYILSSRKQEEDVGRRRWNQQEIVGYMKKHPQRAYFAHLFKYGKFEKGIEVGVAGGRFAEHMISTGKVCEWIMVEPYPPIDLLRRLKYFEKEKCKYPLLQAKSMDAEALDAIELETYDFIYLDGAHDYTNVRLELEPYYQRLKKGGVLAGHDYCNYGEKTLNCFGCSPVPPCGNYTSQPNKRAKNQNGVVRAVQEWLVELHPDLYLYHTIENFTKQSLAADNMDFNLVLTKTRNPSWFLFKPAS